MTIWSNRSILCAFLVLVITSAMAAQAPPDPSHPEDYPRADVEHGLSLYVESCDRCHGPDGAGVSGVNLSSGKFRSATTDQQLRGVISNGFPTAGMPSFRFDAVDMTGIIAYLRNMHSIDRGSLKPGRPERGKLIVETKGACLSCHRIDDKGSYKAPPLSEIGSSRSAGLIERSLVNPDAQLWPINRPVHIVTKSGQTIEGRRLNEDTYTVQLVNAEGRLVSLSKSDLREYRVLTKAGMPSYGKELTPEELSDVVSYLLTLKGLQ